MMRVRAHLRGDIETVFPLAEPFEPGDSKYRFHAVVPEANVQLAMVEIVRGVTYCDFIGPMPKSVRRHHYERVHTVMEGAQRLERLQEAWTFKPRDEEVPA